MTIFEQLLDILNGKDGRVFHTSEIKDLLHKKYNTNPSSVILSDYCYNRYNNGITFDKHIFEFVERGYYKYLGENYPYTGPIIHKPKGGNEVVIGEWDNGELTLY